jgi:alpha-acetolactate decarboxylase
MQAKEAGFDLGKPFPIRMRGTLINVAMHVLRAPNPGFKGHGSDHPMADQENVSAAHLEGEVVGFFAPETAQGVIGHPGEAFHSHWVDNRRTRTAHLDAFGMTKGSQLVLPER